MNTLPRKSSKVGKGRRKSKKLQRPSNTNSNNNNPEGDGASELVSNCVSPSEVSLSSQFSQHQLRPQMQTPLQPPLPRRTKLNTTRRNVHNSNGSGCSSTNSAGSNASNRYNSTKRTHKRSTSRSVAQGRRPARNSYENEDERLISTEPSLLPLNPPPISERGSSEYAERDEETQRESHNLNVNSNTNSNNSYTNNTSCINTFICNNSVIRHEENKKPANMTRTLFPPTILPSTVNNRSNYNITNRYNNNNNNNNNTNNSNINHLRSLGRSSYLSSNAKNTVNRMYGVNNFNSGLVGETKSCSNNNNSNNNMMDKYATNLTRHGKREDWIMINNPAAKRETLSEQTIHLERAPFHHTRTPVNNERFSLPPSSRKYGSNKLNNNLSSVRRMSNKNLKTLSASRIRGRYDSEPIENVRCMESDINVNNNNNNNSSSHLSSLYSRNANSTFADNNTNSIKKDNNNSNNNENFSSNSINVNSNTNNNDEDNEWKRDKLLRGSYVINEDYRRSERDNAQMINFLRERASALNKSRLALEGNTPVSCPINSNHSELSSDNVNGEVLSPKPPTSPSHALCKENAYTRTLISPNNINSTKRKTSNQDNMDNNNNNSANTSQPTLTATPPLPPHSSPAGSLLTSESPNTSSLTPKAQRRRRNVQGGELTCQLNSLLISPESKHNNNGNTLSSKTQGEEPEQETVSTPTMFTSKSNAKNEPFDRHSITNTTVNISLFNRRHQMQLASAQRQSLLNEASQSHAPTNPSSGVTTTTSASPYDFGVVLSSGKSGSLPIVLTAGYGSTQGMRPTMEDEHFIQLNATTARGGGSVSMLGILDGHCGRRVAAMSAKWLPKYFFTHTAFGDNNALALVEAIVQVDRALYHALSLKQGNHAQERGNHTNTSSSNSNSNSYLENDKESDNSHIESLIHRNITSLSSSNDPLNETHHGTEDEFDRPINVRASINNGYNSNNDSNKNGSTNTTKTSTTNTNKDKKSDANHNFLHGVDLELDSFDFDHDEDNGRWDGVGSGGSTLITAAVHGRMLYVACLGDARAVLYDGKTTIAMSEDHKPHNSKESNRITRCGGFVQFGRVCGVLAVSRALGDFEFKFPASDVNTSSSTSLSTPFYSSFITTSYLPPQITSNVTNNTKNNDNPTSSSSPSSTSSSPAVTPSASAATRNSTENAESSSNNNNTNKSNTNTGANNNAVSSKFSLHRELMVSNVADVKQLSLSDESKFLLLACDGLWDVISNEEATQFVKDFLTYTPDINDPLVAKGMKPYPSAATVQKALNNCCKKLAEFAVDRGSSDNVTVMLLFFHDVVQVVTSFSKPMSLSSPSSGAVTPSPSASISNGNIRNKSSVEVSGAPHKIEE